MIPNETDTQHFGFLRLRGTMIKVGADLNYVAITKEIRNDFGAGEVRTDTALNSYTDDEITIRTVGIIYNNHIKVYQINGPARNEDTGRTHTNNNDYEQRMIRAF